MVKRNFAMCPICSTARSSSAKVFACWMDHEPGFWNTRPREELARLLHCTGGRVSQLIAEHSDERKVYIVSKAAP